MYALVLLSAAAVGVDAGWQPLEGGGVEYIIQVEPSLVDWLREGNAITSDVPPDIGTVRSYRIQVGTDTLPRIAATPDEAAAVSTFNAPDPVETAEPSAEPMPDVDETEAPAMEPWDDEPRPFIPPDDTQPLGSSMSDYRSDRLATPASASQYPSGNDDAVEDAPPDDGTTEPKADEPEAPRPWWPLTAALLGLFVSVGGNIYLGWVNVSQRSRYHQLVERFTGRVKTKDSADD